MILTALKELAEREGLISNPHYEEKPVAFVIVLDAAGRLLGLQERSQDVPGKKKALIPAMLVPRPFPGARRTGTQIDPGFLVDNASFVLGLNAPGDAAKKTYPPEELRQRQEAFRQRIADAEAATQDEGVRAVRLCLDALLTGQQQVAVPDDLKSNALLAFVLHADQPLPVHQRPPVVAYWSQLRAEREQPAADSSLYDCLITGQRCLPVDKHPPVKIPGGSSTGIALVSFNNETFESYGLKRNENAAASRYAAEAYTTALNRLLNESYPDPITRLPMGKRHVRLSDDTTVLYWSRAPSEVVDLFSDAVQQAEPEAVDALYSASWKGRPVALDDPSAFYGLTLSGAQGRATIRAWFESTVRDVVRNVRQHFDDLEIARPAFETRAPFPLWVLLRGIAVMGKQENIHPNLAAELFLAILNGRGYPRALLSAALLRARAEREVSSARAALIKAYLLRAKRLGRLSPDFPEVMPMIDNDCKETAYRLGRLFAVLEKAQEDATNASTTIRDRYYGAASATPAVVFGQLLGKARHHLGKLDHAVFYEKLIQEILDPLPPADAFPAWLSLEKQGLFALGYYHQRQELFTKRAKNDNPAPDLSSTNQGAPS